MDGLADILKTITTEMQKSLSPQTVVGDPITVDGKTIVPLMSVGMGFGAGTGKETNTAGSAGGGGGLGMKPIAIVIIDQQGVRIERMTESSNHSLIDHLTDAIPKFMENISRKKETRVEIEGSGTES